MNKWIKTIEQNQKSKTKMNWIEIDKEQTNSGANEYNK